VSTPCFVPGAEHREVAVWMQAGHPGTACRCTRVLQQEPGIKAYSSLCQNIAGRLAKTGPRYGLVDVAGVAGLGARRGG
jgi:hypothetical protein